MMITKCMLRGGGGGAMASSPQAGGLSVVTGGDAGSTCGSGTYLH